MSVNSTVGM